MSYRLMRGLHTVSEQNAAPVPWKRGMARSIEWLADHIVMAVWVGKGLLVR